MQHLYSKSVIKSFQILPDIVDQHSNTEGQLF